MAAAIVVQPSRFHQPDLSPCRMCSSGSARRLDLASNNAPTTPVNNNNNAPMSSQGGLSPGGRGSACGGRAGGTAGCAGGMARGGRGGSARGGRGSAQGVSLSSLPVLSLSVHITDPHSQTLGHPISITTACVTVRPSGSERLA
jgi:hypothetical protein